MVRGGVGPTDLPKNLPHAPQDGERLDAHDPEDMQAKIRQNQGQRHLPLFHLFHPPYTLLWGSRVRGLRKHEEQPCPLPDQVPRPGQWEEVELDVEYNSLVV